MRPQDLELDTWARLTYVDNCLGSPPGYLPADFPDPREQSYVWLDDYGRRAFNEQLAQKWGYHEAADEQRMRFTAALRAMHKDRHRNFDDSACFDQYLRDFGNIDQLQTANFMLFSDPTPTAALTQSKLDWHACVVARGVTRPALDPANMPTEAMRTQFWRDEIPVDDEVARPDKQEIATAVADAQCRAESGYDAALHDAEWRKQDKIRQEHAADLKVLAQDLAQWRERIGEFADAHTS